MKTIIGLALGFWIGRQVYINYDKEATLRKEKKLKERLKAFLEESGWTRNEARTQASALLRK